jgi:hypothetical protein
MPQWKQEMYKYILSVEGTVSPWREAYVLNTGCVMIRAETPYKQWFEPLIEPLRDYVPVDRDLNKLGATIAWCKTHDKECQNIAENAKEFYKKYLDREASLDYLQLIIVMMSSLF